MLEKSLKFGLARSGVVVRSFSGKAYDPKFDRDWSSPKNTRLYNWFLRNYDEGPERKNSMQDYRMTVQSF